MEVVRKVVFSTLLVSWPKPNIFLKLEGRISTSIFTDPVLLKESLSFPVSQVAYQQFAIGSPPIIMIPVQPVNFVTGETAFSGSIYAFKNRDD